MEFQIGMGIYEPWIPDTQDGFNLFPQDPLDNSQPLGPLFDFGSPGDHFSGDDVPGLDNILGQPDYTITASSVTSRLEPWQDEFNLLAQDHPDNNQSLGAIFDFGSPGDHISSDDLPGLDNILGRPDHTIVSHPAPSVPSRLDPAITFCALYINSRGEILGIHPDSADERATFPALYFLGFFYGSPILPLFTDDLNFPLSTFDSILVSLVGVVRKLPAVWFVPIYSHNQHLDAVKAQLAAMTIRPIFLRSNVSLTRGIRAYDLPASDTLFQPWELGENHAHPTTVHEMALPSEPRTGTKRMRKISLEAAVDCPDSKKKKVLKLNDLNPFPEFKALVVWAKGHYRAHCLLELSYLPTLGKLCRAEDSLLRSSADRVVGPFSDLPPIDDVLTLITEEHSVFRSNSLQKAKEIIHVAFPQNIDITATKVVEMLDKLFCAEPSNMLNFFALNNATASASALDSMDIDCPLAHQMVEDLLVKLCTQKIRNCHNISAAQFMKDVLLTTNMISVDTVSYTLSLLVDAFINRFQTLLLTLPRHVRKKVLPHSFNVHTEVECFKYDFLHQLWTSCEDTPLWGDRMRDIRNHWCTIIVATTHA